MPIDEEEELARRRFDSFIRAALTGILAADTDGDLDSQDAARAAVKFGSRASEAADKAWEDGEED